MTTLTSFIRLYEAATASVEYSDHYLLTDKSGLEAAVKVLVSDIAGRVFSPLTYVEATTAQAKIQAAIDDAEAATPKGTVEIPNGTWEITTGITITEAIRLVGTGGTINFNPVAANASPVYCIHVTASDVVIDGINIDGSSMDEDGQAAVRRAIFVAGASPAATIKNVTVRNCTLTNLIGAAAWSGGHPPNTAATHGIYLLNAEYCNVLDNRLDNINGAGMIFNTSSNIVVQRNRIHDTQWGSIDLLHTCSHFEIAYNVITGDRLECRYYACSITLHSEDYLATTHANIHHNIISGIHSYGGVIGVSSGEYVNITDNIIFDVPPPISYIRCNTREVSGVYGPACKNITIDGNILIAKGQYVSAIAINNYGDEVSGTATDFVVTNNQIISPDADNCFAGAIQLSSPQPINRVTIANNAISARPNSAGPLMLGAGAIAVTGFDGASQITNVVITGNHLKFVGTLSDPANSSECGIAVGGYSDNVIVRNNTIDGFLYGLRMQTNSGVNVIYEDNFFANCTTDVNNAIIQTYLGRVSLAGSWYQDDAAASQTNVVLKREGARSNEITMPVGGYIVGITVVSNAARSAGTLTVTATVNGTTTVIAAVLDGSNTTTHYAVQRREYTAGQKFTAGQKIGVKITTDASWAPVTADITVNVLVSL